MQAQLDFFKQKFFSVEAIRGHFRFWTDVFVNWQSILARKMPWLSLWRSTVRAQLDFFKQNFFLWRPLEAKSDFATMFL